MSSFLQFALAIALLIGAARLGGLLSKRLGQPGVLGELLVGVLLGPSLLNFFELSVFTDAHLGEQIKLRFLSQIFIDSREEQLSAIVFRRTDGYCNPDANLNAEYVVC